MMKHPNILALVPRTRKQRPYLDFVINGRPLGEYLVRRGQPLDFIPPFGWPGESGRDLAADAAARLLRKALPDLPSGRTSLLVCPECADLGCGTVAALIERRQDMIVWHEFGFETNDTLQEHSHESFSHLREFAFAVDRYSALFRPFLR